jgi:hypothetical protein
MGKNSVHDRGVPKKPKDYQEADIGGFSTYCQAEIQCVFSIQFGADRGGAGRFSLGIKGQGGKNTKPKTAARAEEG